MSNFLETKIGLVMIPQIFSQIDIPGMPIWMTMVLQGGSFALIVYMIVSLDPKRNKESTEERERRDDKFVRLVETLQERFESRNVQLIQAMDRQTSIFVQAITKSSATIKDAVKEAAKDSNNHGEKS